ncbi:unnamed protein product, partial [Hymenolepis diminuta]
MNVAERRTKVVFRKLPQFLTEDEFRDMISPIPPHDYFRFCAYDPFFDGSELCRAYINFRDKEFAKQFIERFNDYVFVDSQGNQSNAEVSFAINQDTPKVVKARRDPTANTIEEDKLYKKYLESQKEKPKVGDNSEAEKPPWEVILEEIEKLEANPIPEKLIMNFEHVTSDRISTSALRLDPKLQCLHYCDLSYIDVVFYFLLKFKCNVRKASEGILCTFRITENK